MSRSKKKEEHVKERLFCYDCEFCSCSVLNGWHSLAVDGVTEVCNLKNENVKTISGACVDFVQKKY
jgi:hypothetical protein